MDDSDRLKNQLAWLDDQYHLDLIFAWMSSRSSLISSCVSVTASWRRFRRCSALRSISSSTAVLAILVVLLMVTLVVSVSEGADYFRRRGEWSIFVKLHGEK